MQIASIFFFLFCIGGLMISLGSLGQPLTGFLSAYTTFGIYAIIFFDTLYDIWQTGYVIHLLFENVKRITAHRRSTQHDLSRLGKSTGADMSSFSSFGNNLPEREKNKEQLKLEVKTDHDQAQLTMMIIASSTAGFLLLCAGIAMVFMSSDYDENGNQTLFGSLCGQMIYVLGTFD
jgi:hypothetical protein